MKLEKFKKWIIKISVPFLILLLIFILLFIIAFVIFSDSNQFIKEFKANLIYLLPAIAAIIILALDTYLKRIHYKNELDYKEKELEVKKLEYEEVKKDRIARNKWLDEETIKLTNISDNIAEKVSKKLITETKWAEDAIEKAKLGPYSRTLFGERLNHFRVEKDYLVNQFLPWLIRRCKYYIKNKKHVYLLIDSGTTLYTLFKWIGNEAVSCREENDDWINHIEIVTNNLQGMESLMECGRVNPNNRFSPLAIKSQLLPGVPLVIYSAVTGKETEEAIRRLRKRKDDEKAIDVINNDFVFIGLVTGNWIRIRSTITRCPIPLARGEGHKEFKEILMNNCDEVYVISPLGKVFKKASLDTINLSLGFNSDNIDLAKQPYKEVLIDEKKSNNLEKVKDELNVDKKINAESVKLVSTSRHSNRVLYEHSIIVQAELSTDIYSDYSSFIEKNIIEVPHLIFPFDALPDILSQQIEVEFPHFYTKNNKDILRSLFSVPDNILLLL